MASIVYSMKTFPNFVSLNLFIYILKVTYENFKPTTSNLSLPDVVVECYFYAHRHSDTFPSIGWPVLSNIPRTNPQTPRRRKIRASVRLQGIKTTMPKNLLPLSISQRLVTILKLKYVTDDWQVHLIHLRCEGHCSARHVRVP